MFFMQDQQGNECVWDDIGNEIIAVAGSNAMLWHAKQHRAK